MERFNDEDKEVLLDLSQSVLDNLLANPPRIFKSRRTVAPYNGETLKVTTFQDLGNTVHIFSHIKKTYRIFSVILEGGSSPPSFRDDLHQKMIKGKTHDIRTDYNTGARAKWVPEKEVGNANIGTGVMNVWKKARPSWNSEEEG